jgi:hypothetical protein
MFHVGFEPTILVLEWAKTVHALGRVATVIGMVPHLKTENYTKRNIKYL